MGAKGLKTPAMYGAYSRLILQARALCEGAWITTMDAWNHSPLSQPKPTSAPSR